MDEIIKEELWRCVGTFFLAVIISIGLLKEILGPSIFTILIIPLMITISVFLMFVIVRKKYLKGTQIVGIIAGLLIFNAGLLMSYFYRFNSNSLSLIIFGLIIIIYNLIKMKNR